MTDLCDLSAVDARALIGAKRLSPVELVESCIRRIEAVDPAINAMVARDFDGARAAARLSEAQVMKGETLGPLHGLPLGVKDLIDASGLPTTYGSPLFADNVATDDTGAVASLRKAGALVIGKTNTPEWGAGANTRNVVYGATGNPFDPTRSAAGSSGGSAAALAAGMVPIATGSDTGGSLRNPAGFCGVVGFRPTPGLVPGEKRDMAWIQLSTLGPMARTVADAALMLSAMASQDARDPLSPAISGAPRDFSMYAALRAADLSRLRVASTPDFGFAPTEKLIADTLKEKVGLFGSLFAKLDEATPDCSGADEAFEVLRAVLFLGRHRKLMNERPEMFGPNVRANIEEGLRYSAANVADAFALQTALYRRWQEFFTRYDILLAPSVTISPRPWRELYPTEIDGKPTRTYFHWLALAYAVTLAGHPTLSLPVGLDKAGMPFGLQIIGPRGGDAQVLSVALALEREFTGDNRLARPLPSIEKLTAAQPISAMEGFKDFG
ncbi:amidase [Terrarubrum flagellatum]|uniref:amidase n=1 Tax=Terrirubrum flagellatum TaxID=2895980 RepID=UPI00314532B8